MDVYLYKEWDKIMSSKKTQDSNLKSHDLLYKPTWNLEFGI